MSFYITGYSVPFMYDSAGSYRLLVGSESNKTYPFSGWIWYFDNIDGNLNGNFRRIDSTYQDIWEGPRMTVNGADINNDGGMDLIVGNYGGGAAIYMGDSNTVSVHELSYSPFNFSIYPNPATGYIDISIEAKSRLPVTINIYNALGETVYSQHDLKIMSLNRIDVSNLPKGIYSCVLHTDNFNKSRKFVVVK